MGTCYCFFVLSLWREGYAEARVDWRRINYSRGEMSGEWHRVRVEITGHNRNTPTIANFRRTRTEPYQPLHPCTVRHLFIFLPVLPSPDSGPYLSSPFEFYEQQTKPSVRGSLADLFTPLAFRSSHRPTTTTRSVPSEQLTDHPPLEDLPTLRVSCSRRLELRPSSLTLPFESVFEFSSSRTERRVRCIVVADG